MGAHLHHGKKRKPISAKDRVIRRFKANEGCESHPLYGTVNTRQQDMHRWTEELKADPEFKAGTGTRRDRRARIRKAAHGFRQIAAKAKIRRAA